MEGDYRPGVDEVLRAEGIDLAGRSEAAPEVRECARLARRLRDDGARIIGLMPADDHVAVPALALLLGAALARQSVHPVAIVDATGSWTFGPGLLQPASEGQPAVAWIQAGLALVAPLPFDPRDALGPLRQLREDRARFEHLVVDLTGLDHLGELPAALALVDAVLLVARSGRTTVRQVRRWLAGVTSTRTAGVLITGI